jgi:hypothetical protein
VNAGTMSEKARPSPATPMRSFFTTRTGDKTDSGSDPDFFGKGALVSWWNT